MNEKRRNQAMRTIVNLAEKLAESSIRNAAEFMRDHRVPFAVAVRVLINRRRHQCGKRLVDAVSMRVQA